jgi:riboflavin kinase/FMN adenylyltransferase
VVTIGNFDGVHVGHRKLIGEAMSLARAAGRRSVALTFDRHPATVVRPGSAPLLLTGLEQKVELLEATGIDEVVVLTFDEQRAAEPAEDFVHEMLLGRLGARAVVVGSNFRFGHRHRGDVELLAKLGGELGFEVRALELVADDDAGTPVSSSRVRALVEAGELEHAARLLGRPHQLRGTVLAPPARRARRGDAPARGEQAGPEQAGPEQAGPELAAPAAALLAAGMCLPPPGPYAGLLGALGQPGVRGRLWLDAGVVSSPALAAEPPGSPVLVEFLARAAGGSAAAP